VGTQNYGRFVISPLENGYGTTLGNALRRVLLSSLDGAAVTSLRVAGVPHEFSTIPGAREDMMLFILNVKQIRFRVLPAAIPAGESVPRVSPLAVGEEAGDQGLASLAEPASPSALRGGDEPDIGTLGTGSGVLDGLQGSQERLARPYRLRLSIQGQGIVTAGDIICPPEVEIVNPELYLLTVDDPDAELEIEMVVERGRGYSPSEERGKLPIGELPVDAVYSPIRRANFDVAPARVGQMTNYDTLILEIWTDGTMRPQEALSYSAQLLIRHFSLFAGVETLVVEPEPEAEEELEPPSPTADVPIEELDLSVRVYNCLKRTGITKVDEVLAKMEKGPDEMLAIRNFGSKSLDELRLRLIEKGYIGPDDFNW
jgi:DNA-directed RNA polymerase alpha subunit